MNEDKTKVKIINHFKRYIIPYPPCVRLFAFIFCSVFSAYSLASVVNFPDPNKVKTSTLKIKNSTIDYQSAKRFINDIRTDKLDYLKNATKLKQVFETAKAEHWQDIKLEAAALYAELLFRQENYEQQNTHVEHYLKNEHIPKKWDLYLLFLESKLKYLSRQDDQSQAKKITEQFNLWLPARKTNEKIIIYRALAYYYTVADDLKQSLTVALEGLELATANNDLASEGFFLRKISDSYNYFNEKEKSLEYAKQAVSIYEQTQDQLFTSKAYWSLGNALLEQDKKEQALVYITKALIYFKSVNMIKGTVFAQFSVADILYKQANYNKAITLLNENIKTATDAQEFDMQLASMILLADIYTSQQQFEKANQISDDVYKILDKFTRSVYKSNFLSKRYQLKRKLGQTEQAFDAIEQELFFTKKHLEATSASNIKALQVKFEVKEKEDQILRLEHAKDITELEVKQEYQQKIIWRLSAGMAFILVLVSLFLIYKQMLQQKRYHSMAQTDHLTNTLNRRGILTLAKEKVLEDKVTIAIVDLDLFKKVNDTCGHDIGDLVLIAFAKSAAKTLRSSDTFGRYGGEEWLMVLNTTNKAFVEGIFNRLAHAFSSSCADIKAKHPSINWEISFSMGAVVSNSTSNNLDELVKQADTLLYQAKENGRNQVVVSDYQAS